MVRGLGNLDVRSNNPHADTTTGRANHQESSSAVLINQEDEVYNGTNSFDDTKQTSGKERSIGSDNSYALENCW